MARHCFFASEELRGDDEIVLSAVEQYGMALEYASKELKGDCKIVLAAVQQNVRAFEYCTYTSDQLKHLNGVLLL